MNRRIHYRNLWAIIRLFLLAMAFTCPVVLAQGRSVQRSRVPVVRGRQAEKQAPAVLKMRVEEGTVTAEISNCPLHRALQELAERTGIIFEVRDPDSTLVSVRLDGVSLAEAIQRMAADYNTVFFYSRNAEGLERINLVRVFPRGNAPIQPGIVYLGTGTVTKRNDTIVTLEQALNALGQSASVEEREKAVEFLLTQQSDETIQALVNALSDPAPEIRVAAIEGLEAIKARGALPQILKGLKDSHPEVRRSAAMAIGALGGSENLRDLELLRADEDAGVAAAAEMAMRTLSETVKR